MLETMKKYKLQFVSCLGIVSIVYIMTLMQVPMLIRNIFLVASTSSYFFLVWKYNCGAKWEVAVILLGLLARITFCCLDVYTDFQLPLDGGNDKFAYIEVALEYYNGDFHREYTKYPYVLCAIFKVAGINQFAAQYVNVLCWCLIMSLFQKSCGRLNITGVLRLVGIGILSWLPTNIWITSVLLRDTILMMLLFISLYTILCYIQDVKYRYIIYSIVAVWLATKFHGASYLNFIPIIGTVIFYSRKKNKFCLTKKNVLFCVGVTSAIIIFFMIPSSLRWSIIWRLPNMEDGVISGVNGWLASKYDFSEGAGSNYLQGRYLNGYADIIVMTIQKMYYYMFSPVPHLWRSLYDAIAFLFGNALIYLITSIIWVTSLFYKKFDKIRFVILAEVFITTGVYAWGNVNAGAALRHKEKILGIVILLGMYSLKIVIEKGRECRKSERLSEN